MINKIKQTLFTIGDMTYVREVTKLNCMCLYFQFDSICVYYLSLFELVSFLSKQINAFKAQILLLHVFA